MLNARRHEIAELLREAQAQRWSASQIKDHWDGFADPAGYGGILAEVMPGFEHAHERLLDVIGLHLSPGSKVLDLGAGAGRVAKLVLERFPDCEMTLVDTSPNMLTAASEALEPYADRYDVVTGDFFGADFELPADSFDCVVGVLSICHGRTVGQYADLYHRIRRWLTQTGIFACLDHVRGATDELTLLNVASWHEHLLGTRPREHADAAIASAYREDSPLSVSEHLVLLHEAGFTTTDVLYKRDLFALYIGLGA